MSSQGGNFICQKATVEGTLDCKDGININSKGKKNVSIFSQDDVAQLQVSSGTGKVTAVRFAGLPTTLSGTPGNEVYALPISAANDIVGKKVLCIA